MKKMMIWVTAAAVLTAVGFLAFRRYTAYHTLDKGNTEDPLVGELDGLTVHMTDGNFTYVDNGVLMEVITGSWESTDGRFILTIREDQTFSLTLDGETVMEDTLQFTYLQPGKVFSTEFDLSCCELKSGGRIDAFVHNASDEGSGIIRMEIVYEDNSRETVTFHITDHPE